MQLQLSSIYQSKTSALSCHKGPTKSNIQQIFDSTANTKKNSNIDEPNTSEDNNLKNDHKRNFTIQKATSSSIQNLSGNNFSHDNDNYQNNNSNVYNSYDHEITDIVYNDQLVMEYIPNAKILPPISSHSFPQSFLFRIDMCQRKCNMNDPKVVNQKAIFLDEIGDILQQNDFHIITQAFPKEINLKRNILNMIYINICTTKVSHTTYNLQSIYSSMYSDKYEDKSINQANKMIFMKHFFRILNAMIKIIKINDLKVILKICEDILAEESDQIINFFTNFIVYHHNLSMELFNMFSGILCNFAKTPPYLKKIILPLLKILSDNLMTSYRVKISKTVLKIIIFLIKDIHFQFYSNEFIKLINYISEDFSNVYKFLLIYILKYFPQTNTKKQIILLKMIMKCLPNISSKDFVSDNYKLMSSLVKTLSNCIVSPSSIVSQAAFQFFYEKNVHNFISINKQIVIDNLSPAVSDSMKTHWSEKVKKDACFAMSILKHSNASNDNSYSLSFGKKKPVKLEKISSQPLHNPGSSTSTNSTFQLKGRNQLIKVQNCSSTPLMTSSEITPIKGNLQKNPSMTSTLSSNIPKIPKSMNNDLRRQSNNMYIRSISKVPYMHTLLPSNPASSPWTSSSKKNINLKQMQTPKIQHYKDSEFSNFIDNSIDNNDSENSSNNNFKNININNYLNNNNATSSISMSKLDAWNLITRIAVDNDESIDIKLELAKIKDLFHLKAANPVKRRKTLPFNELKRKVTDLDPLI